MGTHTLGGGGSDSTVAVALLPAASRDDAEANSALSSHAALEELSWLLDAAEGYVRAGKARNGSYYVRYKWTTGPLDGRYTFGEGKTLRAALEALHDNVGAVLSGKRHATEDKPYKPRG